MFKQTQLQSNSTLLNENFKELLTEHLPELKHEYDCGLSTSQLKVFDAFKEGKNVLMLGEAGTGKSNTIKTIEEYCKMNLQEKKVYLCATTGISAYNIGGMTIHSFMGIGTGDQVIGVLINRVKKNKDVRKRILDIDVLIVDEISMMSAILFEKINIICQNIRKNTLFFGGIQVVFSGDLLQLLPVFNKNVEIYKQVDERLIIESNVFLKEFNETNKNLIVLKENFRQSEDLGFYNILSRLRYGKQTPEDILVLKKRLIKPSKEEEEMLIKLVSTNKKAHTINQTNLNKIKSEGVQYCAKFKSKTTNMHELLIKELKYQFTSKGLDSLVLKRSCRVMLIKNIDVNVGLVNGSLGTVINFVNGNPVVKFDNGVVHEMTPLVWELTDPETLSTVSAEQIPLILAYACTIHKSQSITLDGAILDLGECFCEHQVYVGLSRLRSLNRLYLSSFDEKRIKVSKKMVDYLCHK